MSTVDLFRTESTLRKKWLYFIQHEHAVFKDPQEDTQIQMTPPLAFRCQTKNGAPHKMGYGKLGEKCQSSPHFP